MRIPVSQKVYKFQNKTQKQSCDRKEFIWVDVTHEDKKNKLFKHNGKDQNMPRIKVVGRGKRTHSVSLMPVNSLNGPRLIERGRRKRRSDFQTPLGLLSSSRGCGLTQMQAVAVEGGGGDLGGEGGGGRLALCARCFIVRPLLHTGLH